ncbi:Spx/MgsR family RNA polymerase-binding regulatory protein [Cardiobacteriaceae bacterium TAE3-ERU3]|nr:Spx/MgsR family RNA polymerase-binding regulatory protein [Cardiobacteriaceae bacterium TAE3-ERU3]
MITLYGISNCDTVRKVRRFLEQNEVTYDFVDVREEMPSEARLSSWLAKFGEALVNKRSTTYREHKAVILEALAQGNEAVIAVLREYPTLIKRPVIEIAGEPALLGWQEDKLTSLI